MSAHGAASEFERFALMGHPVSHSWSPFIHGMFARQFGHKVQYRLIDVPPERFRAQAVQFFLDGGRGLNVTVPHKQAAAELVNDLTPRAARARAVNTILRDPHSELIGDNTDGAGLLVDISVNLGVALRDRRVLVLGAGGATRGVMEPLLAARPAGLVVANRTAERAVELALEFATVGPAHGCGFADIPAGPYDLVLNATSASLQGEVPPIDDGLYGVETVVYDMAYAKGETPFTRHALRLGVKRVYRGWGMLVEQAAEAYLLWHGVRPQTRQVLELLTAASGAPP
jgi:shikimate dehydrogenase